MVQRSTQYSARLSPPQWPSGTRGPDAQSNLPRTLRIQSRTFSAGNFPIRCHRAHLKDIHAVLITHTAYKPLPEGKVGVACIWETPGGWTGCRYHIGCNKEVFDAEAFAVYRALSVIEQRQERERENTILVDSTSVVTRVGDESLGPVAVAAIEVCSRIITNDNSVTIRWVPARNGAAGNEVADQYAKSAATGEEPVEAIPEKYETETSLSHMTRVATEARSKETTEWITAHVQIERR